MFAPDHARAAAELLWASAARGQNRPRELDADRFIGELFRTVAAHVPSPAGVRWPMPWGTESHLRGLFDDSIASLEIEERTFTFRFLGRGLRPLLPHLVRADAEGLRRAERVPRRVEQGPARPRVALDRLGGGSGAIAIPATYIEAVAVTR